MLFWLTITVNTFSFNISERIFCFNSPILKLMWGTEVIGNWSHLVHVHLALELYLAICRKSSLEFELTYILQDHCVNLN